jgi:hypothetical protein
MIQRRRNNQNKRKENMRRKTNSARRKPATGMMFNPAGRVLAGGSRINPARKRRRSSTRRRRHNPVVAKSSFRRNPVRRRNNPASISGLLVASVMAGLGVSVFDILASKLTPAGSPWLRIGVKAGGAYLFQSNLGNSIPVFKKYKGEIALVLGVSAFVDVFKLVILPALTPTLSAILPAGLIPAADDSMGNLYGNAVNPAYAPFS